MNTKTNHFYFGNLPDFEKEAEEARRRAKMPKAPTFSLDDMEEARKAAHEEGRKKGLEQATNSIEQQTEILIQSLTERIHDLEKAESARHTDAVQNSILIATKALEKLLPTILMEEKETLIKHALNDFFSDHIAKSDLVLSVHSSMAGPMQKYAPLLHPDLKLETDDTLSTTSARLEWKDGVFEYKPEPMIDTIINALKDYAGVSTETLDEPAKNPHTDEVQEEEQRTDDNHE